MEVMWLSYSTVTPMLIEETMESFASLYNLSLRKFINESIIISPWTTMWRPNVDDIRSFRLEVATRIEFRGTEPHERRSSAHCPTFA